RVLEQVDLALRDRLPRRRDVELPQLHVETTLVQFGLEQVGERDVLVPGDVSDGEVTAITATASALPVSSATAGCRDRHEQAREHGGQHAIPSDAHTVLLRPFARAGSQATPASLRARLTADFADNDAVMRSR